MQENDTEKSADDLRATLGADRNKTLRTRKCKMVKQKYIDLFCGLGAFHTAFDRINESLGQIKYECVFACDINDGVRSVYQENYGLEPKGDIYKIEMKEMPDFDILCAGFPCQPFSIAGKKKGFQDEKKGNLFYKILDIVDHKQPNTLILENVKNLYSLEKGQTFQIILSELEKRGYLVSHKIIDSRFYNCPQSRQRLFIIADKKKRYLFREVRRPLVPVSSIVDFTIDAYFAYEDKYKLEKCNNKKNSMMKYKLIHKDTEKGGRQGERVYDIQTCGPTICASSGGPGAKTGLYEINGKIRTLTISESLQMFGFHPSYKFKSLKKEKDMLFYLGNSIVVNVLEELIWDL